MKLSDLINEIMGELNFSELERREVKNGYDFKGTLEHYRSVVKDSIKEKSEYFNEEEFYITEEFIKDIIEEIQERIDNDYSCEPAGLVGKKWGELSAELKEDLLSNCNPVDNMCETVKDGECIVDFLEYEYVSVLGAVKDGEVIIDDNAVIYDSRG